MLERGNVEGDCSIPDMFLKKILIRECALSGVGKRSTKGSTQTEKQRDNAHALS